MTSPSLELGSVLLPIDESLYTRAAVLRTCYWFTDRCYVFVTRPTVGTLLVSLRAKEERPTLENPTPTPIETLSGEFQNYLLDQQLRIEIEEQTRGVRELIIAKAFAEAGTLDDPIPGEVRDPVDIKQS